MSSSRDRNIARAPQRERGKRRVAALLNAAAALFAEKGYDAVTMTEVAARAGAPIGSLYQFFPSKEALADAILARFGERLVASLTEIEETRPQTTIPELADALLGLMVGLREERAAASALIEARREASALAAELRLSLRRQVARILRSRIAAVTPERADIAALVVIQLMKAAARQGAEADPEARAQVMEELRHLLILYLSNLG